MVVTTSKRIACEGDLLLLQNVITHPLRARLLLESLQHGRYSLHFLFLPAAPVYGDTRHGMASLKIDLCPQSGISLPLVNSLSLSLGVRKLAQGSWQPREAGTNKALLRCARHPYLLELTQLDISLGIHQGMNPWA